MKPLAVDLFCGRGGVTRGFLAAGFDVIGIDIVQHPDYPREARHLTENVLDLPPALFTGAHIVWASPPCEEFSRHDQPWTRARNPPPPSLALVEYSWHVRNEAKPRFFVLENVRGAQRFIGRAPLHRGPHYLWGDVLLMPAAHRRPKRSYGSKQQDLRAEIPFELSFGFAMAARACL